MKRIGIADNGNILIEMAREEAAMFSELAYATEGKTDWVEIEYRGASHFLLDYTGVFWIYSRVHQGEIQS